MKALFAWPGGKHNLLATILPLIPEHEIYVEVFAGSAKLLFAKEPSAAEIINDQNGELTNFFRVAKHRTAELAEALEHELVHPERFRELETAETTDELDRAIQFVYRTWYSYGAKGEHYRWPSLTCAENGRIPKPLDTVRAALDTAAKRLSRVRIDARDFAEILSKYDSPTTFFYLDPPYVHFQPNGRYTPFTEERRVELFERLAKLQGKFLMSFDDCSEVRELAAKHRFVVEEVATRYSIGGTNGTKGSISELLISPPQKPGRSRRR